MAATDLIVGFVAEDRPGVLQRLSNVVSDCGGNWLESSMTTLGGYFSGSVLVEIDEADRDALLDALEQLEGFTVSIREPIEAGDDASTHLKQINVLGPDRPGVLKEVASELAARQINILEMDTQIRPAPMSGELLFEADACIRIPDSTDLDALNRQLNVIGDALGVDVLIEDLPEG